MMGRLNHNQGQLFYSFHLDEVVPDDHLVREIAAVLDLSWVHKELAAYYPKMGRGGSAWKGNDGDALVFRGDGRRPSCPPLRAPAQPIAALRGLCQGRTRPGSRCPLVAG